MGRGRGKSSFTPIKRAGPPKVLVMLKDGGGEGLQQVYVVLI